MSGLHHYAIRAGSREALLDLLESAQEGKEPPFVLPGETGGRVVDASRIRIPYEEMSAAQLDEAGEVVMPSEPTGFWLCEIWLDEPDAELAAVAGV